MTATHNDMGHGWDGFTMTGCAVTWCQNGPGHDGVHLGPDTDVHGVLTAQRLLHPDAGHGLYVTPGFEDGELGRNDVLALAGDLERAASVLRRLAVVTD